MVNDYYKNNWKLRTSELGDKNILKESQVESLQKMIDSPDEENFVLAEELIRLKISERLVEGLNVGQVNAFVNIIDFFRESEEDAVVLKGYAGTGKTFLVKRVIEYITTVYPNRKIAITAPTNKAVHVLNKNSPFIDKSAVFEEYNEPKNNIVFSTIHKLLGLKEEISATGEQTFVTGKQIDLTKYSYLIVDEVSMLNDDLFKELMKFKDVISFIFMGDPAQIPPINKEHCLPFMTTSEFNFRKIELTEIMRQKGEHPIVEASMIIRENLSSVNPLGDLNKLTKLNAEDKGIIRINSVTERSKVREVIKEYFTSPQFADNSDYIKIIAWKNKTVTFLNDVVRDTIYGDEKKEWNVGDLIVANKALFSKEESRWGIEYKIKANTSDEFVINSIEKVYREFKNEHFKSSPKINFEGWFWKLNVKLQTESSDTFSNLSLYVIHPMSFDEYEELAKEMKKLAKTSYNPDFWVMYFNILKWSDDITYNYAITAHKSQGSTYENIIFIEEDLNHNKKIVERNRIKYTAYTRAKNKMYVLI